MDTRHQINSCDKVKINGIFFQKSAEETRRSNVESAVLKIEQQFRAWSKRSLSTLGKILIVKCFGISQIIFLMQSMELFDADFKKINLHGQIYSLISSSIWQNLTCFATFWQFISDWVNFPCRKWFKCSNLVIVNQELFLHLIHTIGCHLGWYESSTFELHK